MKPVYFLKTAVLIALVLFANNSNAQMVGSEVFLKGKYVELGMCSTAAFGTTSSPTTYHSHVGTIVPGGPLGFVADPAMDGWTVGTPAFMGDYFYPGFPAEGWLLQVNGNRVGAYSASSSYNSSGGITCTGSSISYFLSGSKVKATWQGMIDSIIVTQTTTLDTNDLYFTTNVLLTNTAVLPRNDIYFFRTVDPDNDQTWPMSGGSFTTDNIIEYQSTDTTIVSALGMSGPLSYMAFGTTDTGATAVIYNDWPLTVTQDLAALYNGTYGSGGGSGAAYYTPGVSHVGDIGIALVFSVPHLATVDSVGDSVYRTTAAALHPANTASFTYFYAFGRPAVDSALAHLTGIHPLPNPTLGIQNVNNAQPVKVYPNPSKEAINVTGLVATDHVSLIDIMGRDMGQSWQVRSQGVNTFGYTNVPAGAYILVVTDADGNVKSRTTIKKQ